MLQELVDEGKLVARTKWKEIYPLFREDDRYLGMLGNPGSNPLELFWDVVDSVDQQLDAKIAVVEGAIKAYNAKNESSEDPSIEKDGDGENAAALTGFFVGPETSENEFNAVVNAHATDAVKDMSPEDLHLVFKTVSQSSMSS